MRRYRILRSTVVFIFALLSLRLFYLQILRHSYYEKRALRNFIRPIRIQAPRGRIFDRDGNVLANWTPAFRLHFLSDSFSEKAVPIIASIIGEERLKRVLKKSEEGIILSIDLEFKDAIKIEERADLLPGIVITGIPRRSYPHGKVFSHLLGYTGEVTKRDLLVDHRYRPGDILGKSGLEKTLEEVLRGTPGVRFLAIDATGKIVSMDPRPPIPPEAGQDVVLTVDLGLEEFIDSLLRPFKKGAVVALDAKTGEILALYSFPTFDPTEISCGMSRERWRKLLKDPSKPFLNRALSGLYPPGSLLKPLVGLIGLSLGKITERTRFSPCNGAFRYGNRVWKCWNPAGHGSLDLVHAIEQSCDVYYYQLGLQIGLGNLLENLKTFFEISQTDIGLPGERHHFIPTLAWFASRYGRWGYGPGVVLNLSIGQGEILLTPVEMAYMTLLIARGEAPPPWVIKRIGDREFLPPEPRSLPYSEKHLKAVRRGMLLAVEGEKGTGRNARVPGIKVAGKTGTAQNVHGKDHSLFTCFAPFDDPEIVLTIVIENAGHGSDAAAPIAGKILNWYFNERGKVSEDAASR